MLNSETLHKILKTIKEEQPDILEENNGQVSFEVDEVQKPTFELMKIIMAEQGLALTP